MKERAFARSSKPFSAFARVQITLINRLHRYWPRLAGKLFCLSFSCAHGSLCAHRTSGPFPGPPTYPGTFCSFLRRLPLVFILLWRFPRRYFVGILIRGRFSGPRVLISLQLVSPRSHRFLDSDGHPYVTGDDLPASFDRRNCFSLRVRPSGGRFPRFSRRCRLSGRLLHRSALVSRLALCEDVCGTLSR
jgi:hypothetical protein